MNGYFIVTNGLVKYAKEMQLLPDMEDQERAIDLVFKSLCNTPNCTSLTCECQLKDGAYKVPEGVEIEIVEIVENVNYPSGTFSGVKRLKNVARFSERKEKPESEIEKSAGEYVNHYMKQNQEWVKALKKKIDETNLTYYIKDSFKQIIDSVEVDQTVQPESYVTKIIKSEHLKAKEEMPERKKLAQILSGIVYSGQVEGYVIPSSVIDQLLEWKILEQPEKKEAESDAIYTKADMKEAYDAGEQNWQSMTNGYQGRSFEKVLEDVKVFAKRRKI